MKRDRVRQLVLGAAIAGLVAWWGIESLLPGDGAGPAEAAAAPIPLQPVPLGATIDADTSGIDAAWAEERQAILARSWPDSPFGPLAAARGEETGERDEEAEHDKPALVLNAVLSGTRALAMIDGSIVAAGDTVYGEFTVIEIGSDTVTLQGPEGTRTLQVAY